MSDVTFKIDGKDVTIAAGSTVLQAARKVGIDIPTLCYDDKLEPYGACRLCIVEVEKRGWTSLVVSCLYPVENNIIVRTRSEKVDRIRKLILELLLAHAPDSPTLLKYAKIYGADKNRFDKESSFCIHCGLCVRYCNEVKKLNAVGFVDRGTHREICFVPEIASRECWKCKECFPLCPTEALQAAYVFAEAMAEPKTPSFIPRPEK